MKTKTKFVIMYVVILILLIALVTSLIFNARYDFKSFKDHRGYFKNNTSIKIEEWMSPNTIIQHFNISKETIIQEANITNKSSDLQTPLEITCSKKKINCTELVHILNERVN
jgi:hypothetical protein